MKKLNEDINITDPNLAQQYNRGQALLVQKDQLIVKLQDQINKVEKDKMKIEKELNKISQEAAKQQGQEQPVNAQGQQQGQTDQQTVQVTGTPVNNQGTNESILIKIDGDKVDIEIEQLTDKLVYLQNHNGNPDQINNIQSEIKDLINNQNVKNMIGDQRFIDNVDDIEDESRYSDDVEEEDPEMITDEDMYDEINPDEEDEYSMDYYDQQYRRELEDDYDLDEAFTKRDIGKYFTVNGKNYEIIGNAEGSNRFIKVVDDQGNIKEFDMVALQDKGVKFNKFENASPWKKKSKNYYIQKTEKEIEELEYEIEGLKADIEQYDDRFESPSFEGVEGEIEQFWADLSFEEREILNTGDFKNDKERIKALKKAGSKDPSGILSDYYYYYPEYDPELQKEKEQLEKQLEPERKRLEELKKKLEKKEDFLDRLNYGRAYESKKNPMSTENFYDLSEAYVEDDNTIERDEEEYIDNDFLFYVKVQDEDSEWFIGKIFKTSPDGDWYGIVKAGDDISFDKMSYESEWDEVDIVNFLQDQYDEVEIIDKHEYDDYVENYKDVNESFGSAENLEFTDFWDDVNTWAEQNKYPAWKHQANYMISVAPKYNIDLDENILKQIFRRYAELHKKGYFSAGNISDEQWIEKQFKKYLDIDEEVIGGSNWTMNTK